MNNKIIVLLVGGSASGKDSIANKLSQLGYKQLLSYTTRPKRQGEKDTHIFISENEVEQYKNDMIAYTEIGSYKYFATKQQLYDCDLYVIDPIGVKYLKQIIKDIKFVTIYINLPENIRFQRAIKRGDRKGDILKRFISESERFKEFVLNGEYDYAVTNYDLDKSVQIIKNIIDAERNKM